MLLLLFGRCVVVVVLGLCLSFIGSRVSFPLLFLVWPLLISLSSDIHDGKIKLILGLIWTLILRFQIMAEDEESAGARQALLDWCNSVLNPQVRSFYIDILSLFLIC